MPGPAAVARRERIFTDSAWLRTQPHAHCALGAPFAALAAPCASDREVAAVLALFAEDRYVLWPRTPAAFVVALKAGHGPRDHLRAWALAHELSRAPGGKKGGRSEEAREGAFDARLEAVRVSREKVARMFDGFMDEAKRAGWKIDESALVGGSPATIEVELGEGKKDM